MSNKTGFPEACDEYPKYSNTVFPRPTTVQHKDEYEKVISINSSLTNPAPVEEGQHGHDHVPSRGAQERVLTVVQDKIVNEQPKSFTITEYGVKPPNPQVLEADLENLCPDKDVNIALYSETALYLRLQYATKQVHSREHNDQKPDTVFPTFQPLKESVQTVETVDEVNSEAQDPELVITVQNPMLPEGQAQLPVLPLAPLTVIGVQQSPELSSTKSGSCFEILDVKPNPTFNQQSNSQARPNDNVDSQTDTTTKYPQQIADANQESLGYMDLFKRQLQYYRPSEVEPDERLSLITNVEAGQFPPFESLRKETGLLIFSTERDLIAGEVYIKPHYLKLLGRGGNGRVIQFLLRDRSYAVKATQYRENELNIWSTLQHPNIIPLLAVMIGEQHGNCYQFMPQMSGDLRSMMIKHGDLLTLLKQQPQKREMFLANINYIVAEILNGLVYLDQQRIQHGDLKDSNILVQKECRCVGVLYCKCVDEHKYTLKISDFDCAKQNKFARIPNQLSNSVCETSMTDLQMERVKGTCSYRAPEQFRICPGRAEYMKTLMNGKVLYDKEGPWCDIWSMGVILLKMTGKKQAVHEACMLANREGNSMHPSIEPTSASICLIELMKTCMDRPELNLNPLAKVASECLTIDFTKRPTAEEILSHHC